MILLDSKKIKGIITDKISILNPLFLLYFIIIIFTPVPMNYGGDEKLYIKYLNNIFYDQFYFDSMQYTLRWGMYFIPSIFYYFLKSNPLTFFLSSSLVIYGSFIIYSIILYKLADKKKNIIVIFFFLFWVTNPFIINSTYNLVTESQSIFLFSLVLYFFIKINLENKDSCINIFFLILFAFYLYGIKELNAFLILPILIITFVNLSNYKKFLLVLLGSSFFIFESIWIWIFTNKEFLGRLDYFFFNKSSVFETSVWWNNSDFFLNDGGILTRWLKDGKISKIFFPLGIFVSLYSFIIFKTDKRLYYLSIIFFFYAFCITFAFKSLDPIIPYVPVKIENAVIIIPLTYLLLIIFFFKINTPINKIIYIVLLASLLLRPANFFYKILIPEIKKTNHNIATVYVKFNYLDDYYHKTGCINFIDKKYEDVFIIFSKYKKIKKVKKEIIYYFENNLDCELKNKKDIYKLSLIVSKS